MPKKKNAWLAAILNFILPGLGYIYARVRGIVFPLGLFILSIIVAVVEWDEITSFLAGKTTVDFVLYLVLYPLIFAYDGHRATQEANKKQKR